MPRFITHLIGPEFLVVLGLLVIAQPTQATLPGINGKIAYEGQDGIYTINPDGTDKFRVVSGGFGPGWSPDGKRLVYSAPPDSYLHIVNADGTGDTGALGIAGAFGPKWSPDGETIAFEHNCDIWLVNVDGTGAHNLTNTEPTCTVSGAPQEGPGAWSADGTKILYAKSEAGSSDIFTMNRDGSHPVNITLDGRGNYTPDWSPDGGKIVFESDRDFPGYGNVGEIYTMNADGTNQMNVTNNSNLYWDFFPVWSPDGTKIAWNTLRPPCTRLCLFTMNPDGSDATLVTTDQAIIPAWQPLPAPGPKRSDYKNAAQFCKAERDFLGNAAFADKYGTNENGTNANGKCVSQNH